MNSELILPTDLRFIAQIVKQQWCEEGNAASTHAPTHQCWHFFAPVYTESKMDWVKTTTKTKMLCEPQSSACFPYHTPHSSGWPSVCSVNMCCVPWSYQVWLQGLRTWWWTRQTRPQLSKNLILARNRHLNQVSRIISDFRVGDTTGR